MGVFVIAEAACTWRYGDELATAKRSIEAAKQCGANAFKVQWTSDPVAMSKRRNVSTDYSRLAWPKEWLPKLKAMCDEAGIEFMTTCFLPQDIEVIAPYVKRFKVSAFESRERGFIDAYPPDREVIASENFGVATLYEKHPKVRKLYCVSEYPTALEKLHLQELYDFRYDGLSDHTASTLTGAVAVGCGARIIEKHCKLLDTPVTDPDFGHSLCLNDHIDRVDGRRLHEAEFAQYVQNVRLAEKML